MMKIQRKILNVLTMSTALALVACGGGGSGSTPTPPPSPTPVPPACTDSAVASASMGDMTVACTADVNNANRTCSLIKLQWVLGSSGTRAPTSIQYSINTTPATTGVITAPSSSGFILDGTQTPLSLGVASNTYTVTFISIFSPPNGAPCSVTVSDTIRAATSVSK